MRSRLGILVAAATACRALSLVAHRSTGCSAVSCSTTRPRPGLAHRCAIASLALTLSTLSPRPALADGAVLFEAKCAACHAGGGNVVARSKTLDRAALTANNVDIETIVTMGKNQMPGFGEACAPKPACTFGERLSDADIAEVSKWVDARADDGKWSQ